MKKIIMMIAALGFVGSVAGQSALPEDAELRKSIAGTYTTKATQSDPSGGRITTESKEFFYEDGTFNEEGTMTYRMTIPANAGGGQIYVELSSKQAGTYSIDSAVISYTIDPESLEIEVLSTGGGQYDDMIADQIMQSVEAQRAAFNDPEKADEIKEALKANIVSINEKQMVTADPKTKKKTVHKRVKE